MDIETIRLLIEGGADPDQVNKNSLTLLLKASFYGHSEVVKLLINAGADLNKANNDGVTPLSLVLLNGHNEIVELLINGGSDIDQKIKSGTTALLETIEHFLKSEDPEIKNKCQKSIITLVENGAEIHKITSYPSAYNVATKDKSLQEKIDKAHKKYLSKRGSAKSVKKPKIQKVENKTPQY